MSYLKLRTSGHATLHAYGIALQAAAKSWTWLQGRNRLGSPYNRRWLIMTAKSNPTGMLCLDASSTKVKANLIGGFPRAAPRSSMRQFAPIPAVANTTRQLFEAHAKVGPQPGVSPRVGSTFFWSNDWAHVGQ